MLNGRGLLCIARYSSVHLLKLFELAKANTPEGKAIQMAIAKALVEKSISDNRTALHEIASSSSTALLELFKLANSNSPEGKTIQSVIAKTLVEKKRHLIIGQYCTL